MRRKLVLRRLMKEFQWKSNLKLASSLRVFKGALDSKPPTVRPSTPASYSRLQKPSPPKTNEFINDISILLMLVETKPETRRF